MEKMHGMYRGVVVDNADPLEAGRVKINLFSIFDSIPVDALPWAQYADPMMGGGADVGGFIVPDIGSHVWCFFEQGDFMTPVYFAGAPSKPHLPAERLTNYPNNKVFKTAAGALFEIDDTEGAERIKVTHPSGSYILLDFDGSITAEGEVINANATTVNVTATTINFDATTTNITGVLNVTGLASLNGGFAATAQSGGAPSTISGGISVTGGGIFDTATIGGIDFAYHGHTYLDNGSPAVTAGPETIV